MNQFNRLVVALLLLAVLVGSAAAGVAVLDGSLRASMVHSLPWAGYALEQLPSRSPASWTAAGICAVICLFALLLLLLEGRSDAGPERVLLSDDAGGEVAVVVESIRRLTEHVAQRVPMVREVRSRVVPTRRGLRVSCRVAVDPAASVPDLAREIQNRVGTAVEHHLGRPVSGIGVTTQITPLTSSRRRVR